MMLCIVFSVLPDFCAEESKDKAWMWCCHRMTVGRCGQLDRGRTRGICYKLIETMQEKESKTDWLLAWTPVQLRVTKKNAGWGNNFWGPIERVNIPSFGYVKLQMISDGHADLLYLWYWINQTESQQRSLRWRPHCRHRYYFKLWEEIKPLGDKESSSWGQALELCSKKAAVGGSSREVGAEEVELEPAGN